jgi:hypothetical protein
MGKLMNCCIAMCKETAAVEMTWPAKRTLDGPEEPQGGPLCREHAKRIFDRLPERNKSGVIIKHV